MSLVKGISDADDELEMYFENCMLEK